MELFVNGKSIGTQRNMTDEPGKRNIIYWKHVPYGKGGNITAVARTGGKEVARHRLETTGKAERLNMVVENAGWKAGGMDLQYVKVYAIDGKGRIVPTVEEEIAFEVSGAAKLIAVDNGDHSTNTLFSDNKVKLYNGFAMAVLRSDRTAGEVVLKVSADTLKGCKKKLLTTE